MNHELPVLYSVDLCGCDTLASLAAEDIISTFAAALENAGATVVQTSSHAYPGAGLTCVLILRESHAVLHTWPETGTVNIDIFSCSTQAEEPGRHQRAGPIVRRAPGLGPGDTLVPTDTPAGLRSPAGA